MPANDRWDLIWRLKVNVLLVGGNITSKLKEGL